MVISFAPLLLAAAGPALPGPADAAAPGTPQVVRRIEVPRELLVPRSAGGPPCLGDLRVGDLDGDGRMDFVVFGSVGGLKPGFLGAFTADGDVLWTYGDRERRARCKAPAPLKGEGASAASEGFWHTVAPIRPGPAAIHDLDGDGRAEVLCLALEETAEATDIWKAEDLVLLLLDGRTGAVKRRAAPDELRRCMAAADGKPEIPNYVHQRLLVANFRGGPHPRDFAVKMGNRVLAFDDHFRLLWSYRSRWSRYTECGAYIPAVGDVDGDGRDELLGGYYLLDHDGRPLWEGHRGPNVDSVLIEEWDGDPANGREAILSGSGQVVNARGDTLLSLGEAVVPHGQEIRCGNFRPDLPGKEMVIRYDGHTPRMMVVGCSGEILARFEVAPSPNETGMEMVRWNGPAGPDLLYAPAALYDGHGRKVVGFPDLPPPTGGKMGWFHCFPIQVEDDGTEGVLLYDPLQASAYLHSPRPPEEPPRYRHTPRQYNARLMD